MRSAFFKAVLWVALTALASNLADAQPITTIATGRFHSFFLKVDGSLWATGEDAFGQLGDGLFTTASPYGTNLPVRSMVTEVTAVAAGSHHTLVIRRDSSLWGMGANSRGQLGGVAPTSNPPVIGAGINPPECLIESGVVAVAAGEMHSLLVKQGGALCAMGRNSYGQLGDGTTNDSLVPIEIVSAGVTGVAANYHQTFFVKEDRSLWAMGYNTFGQLGIGTYGTGRYTNVPTRVLADGVVAVAAGENHTLVLKSDGSLWGMGNNSSSQLGDEVGFPVSTPRLIVTNGVKAIAAGFSHSLFLKTDGSLWGMGDNAHGQLGDVTLAQVKRPKQLIGGGVTAIATVNSHSLFLKEDGSLWATGNNTHGELGDGTFLVANRPKQILGPYNHLWVQSLNSAQINFGFMGMANASYSLDRSYCLSPPAWIPQETNCANYFGALLFTNAPNPATNNFWRVRCLH